MFKCVLISLCLVSQLWAASSQAEVKDSVRLNTTFGDTVELTIGLPERLQNLSIEADSLVVTDHKVLADRVVIVGSFTNWLSLGDATLTGRQAGTSAFVAMFCRLTGDLLGAASVDGEANTYGEVLFMSSKGMSMLGSTRGASFRLFLNDIEGKVLELGAEGDAVEVVEDLSLEPRFTPKFIAESNGSVVDPTVQDDPEDNTDGSTTTTTGNGG